MNNKYTLDTIVLEERIQEILATMDWGKIHRAMTFLNWEYRDVGVPTIPMLKSTAEGLLRDTLTPHLWCTFQTGGFEALRHRNDLKLSFVLDSWEECDDEMGGIVSFPEHDHHHPRDPEQTEGKTLNL